MTERKIPSHDELALLIAKGRAERARVLGSWLGAGAARAVALVGAVAAGIERRLEHMRALRELRELDPRMLADIGLTPGDVELAARGELARRRSAVLRAANESFAPTGRTSPKAA